jgi:hypothetical protein
MGPAPALQLHWQKKMGKRNHLSLLVFVFVRRDKEVCLLHHDNTQ